MRLGYNTNGLAHHRLLDAIEVLAEEGYESVAITLDAGALDPYQDAASLDRDIKRVRAALDQRGLARVVETGARYLLNPRIKHDPTLMDPDPARRAIRLDFLRRAIDVARSLQAETVSLWSGKSPVPMGTEAGMARLARALEPLLEYAEAARMPLAFEPEPGMFIDTLERFADLDERVNHPLLDLTIDVGHVHCMNEGDIPGLLRRWRTRIRNIHIEDMVPGVHEHLMFGAGTMEFAPIIRGLHGIDYQGGVHVELSRHSHMAVEAVSAAAAFLRPLLGASRERNHEDGP
jgi:sugar phosphate isomerase/epimerase